MSAFSDWLEDKITRLLWRDEAITLPTSVHVALFTAAAGEAGGGTEVTGGSYARVAVVRSPTASSRWSAPGAGTGLSDNLDILTFPTATANWGTVVAFAIFDAAAAGNLLMYANLGTSKVVNTNDVARFLAGALDLEVR